MKEGKLMKNSECRMHNEIKRYLIPEIEIIKLPEGDVIITSAGTETPLYEESDGVWEFDISL